MGGEQALTASADVRERLAPADLRAGGLLAASHVHRYEFAAALCAGRRVLDLCCGTGYGARILARRAAEVHGVDVSDEAISTARAELRDDERSRITFEEADALAYLRALAAGRFDVVVCFEGLEHVTDPDAVLGELARLADEGAALIVSFPNSRGFEEDNEFHVTDYGYEEMRAAASRLPGAMVLSQYLAEASLLLPPDVSPGAETQGRLMDAGEAEAPPEAWANHWLVLVNLDLPPGAHADAGLALTVAPHHNEYMRMLERANAEIRRTNARLGRGWLGVHDAAAASAEARRRKLEAKVAELERRLEHEQEVSKGHHELMLQYQAALQAPRYRAVDAIRTLAFMIPGVGTVLRLRSRLIQRRR
jgi:2-polyprenyl-3-methyl-5-hydroxy-6-metoxy-1,4-benzoquinol methylase